MSTGAGVSPAAYRIERHKIHHRKAAQERLLFCVFVEPQDFAAYIGEPQDFAAYIGEQQNFTALPVLF
jgi:hypothetical protein